MERVKGIEPSFVFHRFNPDGGLWKNEPNLAIDSNSEKILKPSDKDIHLRNAMIQKTRGD
jgi:hypothetical protein